MSGEMKQSQSNGTEIKTENPLLKNIVNPSKQIVSWLFETKAIRVAPPDKPFWYTSGSLGPFYVNTHFLYGSEEKAAELLAFIDITMADRLSFPSGIIERLEQNYVEDPIYRGVIDELARMADENIGFENVDAISCGERRDWFFGPLLARIVDKPCIFLFKDLTAIKYENGKSAVIKAPDSEKSAGENSVKGLKVLHVADLITEASSYSRAWIPALKSLGAVMKWSLVVVDRDQGGEQVLKEHNVRSLCLVRFNEALMEEAFERGYISRDQLEQVRSYIRAPGENMEQFLRDHPDFLKESLESPYSKVRERARLLAARLNLL